MGSGTAGKQPVIGVRHRNGEIRAYPIESVRKKTLQDSVKANVKRGAVVYTDALPSYEGIEGYTHVSVAHHKGEYVRGDCHTNSIESFWSVLKCGYRGTHHFMSFKYLRRYG